MSTDTAPASTSRFRAAAPQPAALGSPEATEGSAPSRTTLFTAPAAQAPEPRSARTDPEGYVMFAVGGTTFAVAVTEVREVIRAARLELLPGTTPYGRALALVDVRGRAIPVIDLRSGDDEPGDVLLPVYRHHVGLVVDRVLAVRTPLELVPEHDDVPDSLPSYSRGVLRPVDGGDPVLLIAMPDAAEVEIDAARVEEPHLGQDVLSPR